MLMLDSSMETANGSNLEESRLLKRSLPILEGI